MKDKKTTNVADPEIPGRQGWGGCLLGREALEQCFSKEPTGLQTTCSSPTLISCLRSLSMKKKKSAELNNELSKGLDLHSSSSPLSPCSPVTKSSHIGPPVDHTLERPGSQVLT